MKAVVIHVKGGGLVGRSESKHWTVMDWPEATGGAAGAPTPMEMVLMALGSCSAVDVVQILAKQRTPVESLRVELSAERREEHPRIFTRIHVEYVVRGEGIKEAALERAITLSEEKYCSVSAMLRGSVEITSSYRLEP